MAPHALAGARHQDVDISLVGRSAGRADALTCYAGTVYVMTATTAEAATGAASNGNDVRQPEHGSGTLDGPWDAAFWVYVDGTVRSKSNYRQDGRGSWVDLANYETAVFSQLRTARPAGWDQGDPAAPVPARPQVVAVLAARTMLDVGNISKSVLDAAEGVLYVTDAQVSALSEFSTRTRSKPGLIAAFALLPAGSGACDAARAAASLLSQVTDIAC